MMLIPVTVSLDQARQFAGEGWASVTVPKNAISWRDNPAGGLVVPLVPLPEDISKNYRAGADGNIYSCGTGSPWVPLKAYAAGSRWPRLQVTISRGGRRQKAKVHRLILEGFWGPPTEDRNQSRHLDGDIYNNRPGNLVWGSKVENEADKRAHGTSPSGERHHNSHLSDEERDHIRWAVEKGLCSRNFAAKVLGISLCAVQGACRFSSTSDESVVVPERPPAPECRILLGWVEETDRVVLRVGGRG